MPTAGGNRTVFESMSNLATTYWHRVRELETEVAEERRRSLRLEASLAERDVLIRQMQETITTLQEEVQKLKGAGRKQEVYRLKTHFLL